MKLDVVIQIFKISLTEAHFTSASFVFSSLTQL